MYNFDQIIDRRNTNCVKYDNLANVFGSTDILPMWVADMDFQVAPEILDAAPVSYTHLHSGNSRTIAVAF